MASNSLGRYSEIGITTVQAFLDEVSSVDGTTITIDDDYNYLKDTVYADGTLVVTTGDAQNKMEDIASTDAASHQIVLDSAITSLAADDEVAIIPKPLAYLCLESESLKETINWDDTECLQTWESTHHTALTVDTGGDLGLFVGAESQALDLVLAATLGQTSAAAGLNGNSLHYYEPGDTVEYLTVVVMRGNHVSLQAYCGMMVDSLVIEQPAGGMATARVSLTGGFGIQEVSTTAGEAFSTGAGNFWNPPSVAPDPKRMHFRHLVVSAGAVPKKYAESGSVTFSRNPATDRRLGDYYVHEPASAKFETTGELVQWFETDDELLEWRGGTAAISDPSTRDLQYKWTGTATTGTYLQIDAYETVWTDSSEPIAEGRIKETLTWKAKFDSGEGRQVYVTYENNNASP